jgi:alkylation response protein AidB-like acyl-CoA dehydrogenase
MLIILSGYGYPKNYPVERHMGNAEKIQIIERTDEIQRKVIALGLLKI